MELTDLVKNIGEKLCEDEIATVVKQLKESGYAEECFVMTTGIDLLTGLVYRNMITTSDLKLLDKILYFLGRKELIDILIKFKNQPRLADCAEKENWKAVTLLMKYTRPTEQLCRALIHHLSFLVSLPREFISLKRMDNVSEGGTVTLMMKQVYVEILEGILQNGTPQAHLNLYGVTGVNTGTNPNVFFQIVDTRIPATKLQEYIQMVEMMKKQNGEFADRLEKFDNGIYSAIQIMSELGDLSLHAKALTRLHKSSGMSITLWKTTGKLSNGQLPEHYTPHMMQDEIRQACLYSKGRLARLYPGRTWEVKIGQ